jgi:hypothetical protein
MDQLKEVRIRRKEDESIQVFIYLGQNIFSYFIDEKDLNTNKEVIFKTNERL